jgi:hypothetical protein
MSPRIPRPRLSPAFAIARVLFVAVLLLLASGLLIGIGVSRFGTEHSQPNHREPQVAGERTPAPPGAIPVRAEIRGTDNEPIDRAALQEDSLDWHITVPGVTTGDPAHDPTPTPVPGPPPPPHAFLELRDQLEAQIAAHPYNAEIAIAVTDLQTGHTIDVHGTRPHLSGCVMNLFVILETVRMVQDGEIPMSSINSLVYATTWSSNAVTANTLYTIAGGGNGVEGVRRVAALIDELGLIGTILDHPPGYPGTAIGVDPNNWVTAVDTNRALELLYHDEILDPAHTGYVMNALSEVKWGLNYLTAAGVPSSVTVSHKNGFFPSSAGFIDNDVGIVRFWRDGQEYAYAVSFFSQYNPFKYSQIPLAQQMMRTIWAYFDQAYP